ncbi:major facilitator superfamily domain-containing protein 6-like [Penaeus indicus]|uniref:major facilitator superfamily domain-containing protein 6-like n=1 Tax=Penaeus indicus TaxID=29960 RepID=UPI00300D53BD
MKIDRSMIPMKMHYILRYAGTGPLMPFLTVIARQKGMANEVVSLIWTVMPFASILVKTSAGALADYLRAHRAFFVTSVMVLGGSLTGIYWCPDITPDIANDNAPNMTSGLIRDSTTDITKNITFVNMTDITKNNTFDVSKNATFDDTTDITKNIIFDNTADITKNSTFDITSDISNASRTHSTTGKEDFKNCVGEGDVATSLTLAEGDICSRVTNIEDLLPMGQLVHRWDFWVLVLLLMTQFCAFMVQLDLQETVCFQMLGDKPHKYGLQRLWGTVSYGATAVIGGALVDWYSQDLPQKDYLPVHIMVVVFLTLDVVVVSRLRFTVPDKKISSAEVNQVFKRPTVILTLITTVVLGMCSGMVWTFHFLLVEDTAALWDPDFEYLKLLQGLLLGVQCLLSEVPCFFLTGKIISKLGYSKSLFVSLLGYAARFCLYAFVTNPWWYLPVELFHGVSFSLSLGCATMFANSVTPPGAEATMQAIFGSSLHCANGLGGLVGGWLFHVMSGWTAFLVMGVGVGGYAFLYLAADLCVTRMFPEGRGGTGGARDSVPRETPKEEVHLLEGGEASQAKVLPATSTREGRQDL